MLANMTEDDRRWAAVTARDAAQDGAFFYSVRTTGVFCRPSCGARPPLRANVAFHDTSEAARAAGFRPCKRCRPEDPPRAEREAAMVARACRMIEAAESPPSLAELAHVAGLSPHHFHRLFKAVAGVTPKAYADAQRAEKLRDALGEAGTVTEACYDAGFNSSGRFYEQSQAVLGMTPGRFRSGGEASTIRFAVAETSLGALLVGATEAGVCALLLGDDPEALVQDLQDRFGRATLVGDDPAFDALVAMAVGLVERPSQGHGLPLDVRGTAFQQKVWQALRDIPAGKTAAYADIARAIGRPSAVRAVAQACGANRLAVAIPCHRVVRTDGDLSGYRWGVERKRVLLEREKAA